MKHKVCWLAKEYRKGWKLGFCVGNHPPIWLRSLSFGSPLEVSKAMRKNIVFVEMAE